MFEAMSRVVLGAGLLASIAEFASADDFAYVTTTTQAFGTLDLNTGVFNQVGTSATYLDGLGEANGNLYGVAYTGSGNALSNTLYTINTANGALTAAATTSVAIWEMGSTTTGLFGLGPNYQNLYSINPVTGAATLIGPVGISTQTTSGISVGANGLYLEISSPGSSSLYTINTASGAATLIGNSSPGVCLKSMAFENGNLYDASGYCFAGSKTFTVNTSNGSANFLANVTGFGDLNGMAPVITAVSSSTPEPATLGLFGASAALLLLVGGVVKKTSKVN